jgi:ankyrin repeat protein
MPFFLQLFIKAGDGLLAIAAWHGNIEVVQMLLLEFNANVNAENCKKTTPLHRASAGGCYSCVEILLNRGADVEFCDATGRRPVDVGSNDAVRDLIKVKSS